jgi:DNA-binding IclR family transcriptional regulator
MNDETRIPTNLRILRILEILGNSDKPMSPTEINQELGLPKQTVHRLCKTLVIEGYLAKESNGKRLRPARRLRTLASGVLFASRFHLSRHQILIEIAAKVNETVNFVVPEEKGMKYLDRVETDWPFRILLPIGTHVPFHSTASGKTYLASLQPAARKAMVECLNLEKITANTHDNASSLLRELDEVAKQGYALDNEEFVAGMVAVAVPVKDDQNRYCASLAFHGPAQRLSIENARANVDLLTNAAQRMSNALFS